jgi:ring-1,2-phenylacetyl-CoA epoxidase subunit PaaD
VSSKAAIATHSVRAEPVEASCTEVPKWVSTGSTRTDVLARAEKIAAQIPDPEIPVITLADLGVLRDVREENGEIVVTITPTYAGCPAMHQMEDDLHAALTAQGIAARVETVLTPAWTTDWILPAAREKLRAYGIAPPQPQPAAGVQPIRFQARVRQTPACPHCSSDDTELLSQFGSTACKSLYRCRACKEPFDYFKPY